MTEKYTFGLIGEQIGYSLSPAVFEAIFTTDGRRGTFELFDIGSEDFDTEFQRVIQSGVNGLAVTIPHKERVLQYLDEVDEAAEALSAVNSIGVGARLRGYNTDVIGFGGPLAGHREQIAGRRAVILGNGGAARAAVYALRRDFDVRAFTLVSRRSDGLEKTRAQLLLHLPVTTVSLHLPDDTGWSDGEEIGLVVNATPLGGWNFPDLSPLPKGFDWSHTNLYYDLNYNDDNLILSYARQAGVTALDGSAMLVGQALESYRLWTGRTVPFEPVYRSVFPHHER